MGLEERKEKVKTLVEKMGSETSETENLKTANPDIELTIKRKIFRISGVP